MIKYWKQCLIGSVAIGLMWVILHISKKTSQAFKATAEANEFAKEYADSLKAVKDDDLKRFDEYLKNELNERKDENLQKTR